MLKIYPTFQIFLLLTTFTCQPLYAGQTLTLASQNMNRLFDDKDDGKHEKVVTNKTYLKRIKKLSEKISTSFERPDIIALQEVENLNILKDVAEALKNKGSDYQAVLIEGNDISGIDVGFLVNTRYRIIQQRQLFKNLHSGSSESYLFSRPPLLIEVCIAECVTIINVHLRSMRELRSKKQGKRVATKRKQQAETLAQWVNQFQLSHPLHRLVIVGDFNALPVSDKFVDVTGIIRGKPDQARPGYKSTDLIVRDLIDLTRSIPAKQRYSFVYKKHKQQLDYLLIGNSKNHKLKKLKFSSIDYRFSDHAALIAEIELVNRN
jgi:endonuclease/exonuclease/phosphatase family metal-dependent hydrolase